MSPLSPRAQGFTVGNIGNLRNDLMAEYNAQRYQDQLAQQQSQENSNDGINWLNVLGLGALAAGLGAGAYALTRGRRPPTSGREAPRSTPPTPPPSGPSSSPSQGSASTASTSSRTPSTQTTTTSQTNRRSTPSPQRQAASQPQPSQPRPQAQQSLPLLPARGQTSTRVNPNEGRPTPIQVVDLNRVAASTPQVQDVLEQILSASGPNTRQNTQDLAYRLLNNQIRQNPIQTRSLENDPAVLRALYALEADPGFQQRLDSGATRQEVYIDPQSGREVFDLISTASPSEFSNQSRVARNLEAKADEILAELRGINTSSTVDLNTVLPGVTPNAKAMESGAQQSTARQQKTQQQNTSDSSNKNPILNASTGEEAVFFKDENKRRFQETPISVVSLVPQNQTDNVDPRIAKIVDAAGRARFEKKKKAAQENNEVRQAEEGIYKPLSNEAMLEIKASQEAQNQAVREANAQTAAMTALTEVANKKARIKDATLSFPEPLVAELYDPKAISQGMDLEQGRAHTRRLQPAAALQALAQFGDMLNISNEDARILANSIILRSDILKRDLRSAQGPAERKAIRAELQRYLPQRIDTTGDNKSAERMLREADALVYKNQKEGTFIATPESLKVLDDVSIAMHNLLLDDYNATVASKLVGMNPGELGAASTKGLGWLHAEPTLKDRGIQAGLTEDGEVKFRKGERAGSHKTNRSDLKAVLSVDLGNGMVSGTAQDLGISHDLAENGSLGSGIGELGGLITGFMPQSKAIDRVTFTQGANASGKTKNPIISEDAQLAFGEDIYDPLYASRDYSGQYVGGVKGFYADSNSFDADIKVPTVYQNEAGDINNAVINKAINDGIIRLNASRRPGDDQVYRSLHIPSDIVFSDIEVARNYVNDLNFTRRYGVDSRGRTRGQFSPAAVKAYGLIDPKDNAALNAAVPLLSDYNYLATNAADKAIKLQGLLGLKEIDDTTGLIPSVPSVRSLLNTTDIKDNRTFGTLIQEILSRPQGSYLTTVSPSLAKRSALKDLVLSSNPDQTGIIDSKTGDTIGLLRSVGNKGGISYLEPTKIQTPTALVDEGLSLLLALDDNAKGTKTLTPIDKQRLRGMSGRMKQNARILPEVAPVAFLSKSIDKYGDQMENLGIQNRDLQAEQSQSILENAMDSLLEAVRSDRELTSQDASRFQRSAQRIRNEQGFQDVLDPLSPEYNEEIALGVSAFRPNPQNANLDLNEQRYFNQDLGGPVTADALEANYGTALEDALAAYGSGFYPMKPRLSSIYDYNVAAPLVEVPSGNTVRIKQLGGRINEPLLFYGLQNAQLEAQKQLPLRIQKNRNIESLDDAIEASELRGYNFSGKNPILTRAMIDAATLGQFSSPYRLKLTKQSEIKDARKRNSDSLYDRDYDGPDKQGSVMENPEATYNMALQAIDQELSAPNLTSEQAQTLYEAKTNLLSALANYRSPDGRRQVAFKNGIPVGIISDAQRRANRAQVQSTADLLADASSGLSSDQPEISVVRRQSGTGGRSRNMFAEDGPRRRSASNTLSLTDINDLLQQQKEQDDYVPAYKSVIADVNNNTNQVTFEIGDTAFDPLENIELTPEDLADIRDPRASAAANQVALQRQAQRNNLIYDAIQKLYKPGVQSVTMQVGQRGGLGNILNATETMNTFGMTPEQLRVRGNIALGNAQQMRDANRRMRNNERALESPEVSTLFGLVPEATRTSPETQLRLAQMIASADPAMQSEKAMTLRGLLAQRQAETLRKAVPLVQELDPTKQARLALLIDAMKPGQQLKVLSNLNTNLEKQFPYSNYR